MALDLSHRLGLIDRSLLERTKKLFISANLPIHPPENMSEDDFLSIMSVDKKVFDGHIRLVLLEELGRAIVTDKFDMNLLKETLSLSRQRLL